MRNLSEIQDKATEDLKLLMEFLDRNKANPSEDIILSIMSVVGGVLYDFREGDEEEDNIYKCETKKNTNLLDFIGAA